MDIDIFYTAFGIIIYILVCGVYGREVCQDYGIIESYCSDGQYCCNNNRDCCTVLSTSAIVGIVIGCIFVIVVVIGVCAAFINSMSKTGSSADNVITPATEMHIISQPPTGVVGPAYPPDGGQGASGFSDLYPPPYTRTEQQHQTPGTSQ